jgi:hypothetical protein
MEVKPGELIHLDEHGAVKFPANQLEAVFDKIEAFDQEEKAQSRPCSTPKTLKKSRMPGINIHKIFSILTGRETEFF